MGLTVQQELDGHDFPGKEAVYCTRGVPYW